MGAEIRSPCNPGDQGSQDGNGESALGIASALGIWHEKLAYSTDYAKLSRFGDFTLSGLYTLGQLGITIVVYNKHAMSQQARLMPEGFGMVLA